ncbi:2-hydroxyacid dehydrogenase [Calidifontibacter sp. DB0510]|uniref:2-hydroxyacid dehydrogenase n=1 Tax=Metallococcus carri TaxID=1656884 RepID=A0A967B1K5_9MICO|nr:2-hydroxyacid dehydrogenase [Metallococcus carri]NHN55715.1 2-hydroxyacid dehydrogenase [Metallococcus carri]NOP38596.1 2-hydroxyacid dehydrogenase [Calidifontibacter sp. DB2511S]
MTVVSVPRVDWAEGIADLPGLTVTVWDLSGPPPRDDIEVLVPPYEVSSRRLAVLRNLKSLKAIQLPTAGFEHALPHLPEGVVLANAKGVHDTSTAELALTLALAAQRGIPQAVRAQDRGEWEHLAWQPSLADRKVLVVGYGSIGRAIVRRLLPFEVEVTVCASSAREGDDLVDRVHAVSELPDLLPEAEIVILIVPLTDATRRLVDADFLARMPRNALLVNVARGGVVDTEALVEACASGRVRAALDVTDPEPLPAGHPLMSCPGVLITGHVGGATSAFSPRLVRLLREQLTRYAETGALEHVVATGS